MVTDFEKIYETYFQSVFLYVCRLSSNEPSGIRNQLIILVGLHHGFLQVGQGTIRREPVFRSGDGITEPGCG